MKYCILILCLVATPSVAQLPQGFFLDNFQAKSTTLPPFVEFTKPSKPVTATVVINPAVQIAPVSKYLFGNNANPYMTQMVDQPVLLNHISALSPNVIRFPGGNLSSLFFWNSDPNVPPLDAPAKIVDANGAEQNPGYWYGKNNASWTLSVDNYYAMLDDTEQEGIITINYGYARYGTGEDPVAAAAHLAADWVRYDDGRTQFWEIGNESNGAWQAGFRIKTSDNQDGQPEIITGALYGKHVKVFVDSMKKAAAEKGHTIYIGAQLLQEEPASWWNTTDKNWNTGVFQEAGDIPDYYIIHSYYTPYDTDSKAADILNTATTVTKNMMEYVTESQHEANVALKPIALTEWNIFAVRSKQQASYINGMHAAITLGELIKNQYGLSCRWDLANAWESGNDHGLFNNGDEPGGIPKWNPRAAFYYMFYFQKHMGDHLVNSHVSGATDMLTYASTFDGKDAGLILVNKGLSEQTVSVEMKNFIPGERYYLYSLTGGTDNGEFSLKVNVNGNAPSFASGGPSNYATLPARSSLIEGGIKFTSPARSVQYVLIEGSGVVTSLPEENANGISISPNPSNGNFTIELPSTGFKQIKLYDGQGKLIYECSLDPSQSSHQVKLTRKPGMLFMHAIKNSEDVLISKVVIE